MPKNQESEPGVAGLEDEPHNMLTALACGLPLERRGWRFAAPPTRTGGDTGVTPEMISWLTVCGLVAVVEGGDSAHITPEGRRVLLATSQRLARTLTHG